MVNVVLLEGLTKFRKISQYSEKALPQLSIETLTTILYIGVQLHHLAVNKDP